VAGTVSGIRTIAITYRILIRQLVTTGRMIALSLIGLAVVLVGWSVGNAERNEFFLDAESIATLRQEDAVFIISLIGFTILVPVVALVFAAATLGDMREDGTLLYLWLRPMPRWAVAAGAWLSSLTISLPLTLIPLGLTALALDTDTELVVATLFATAIGVIAYTALFVLLGTLVRNAIVWGLGYVIIWEGIVAAFGTAAAKVAVRGYTSSILTARTDIEIEVGNSTQTTAILVPLLIALGALTLASLRLGSLEVE